MFHQQYPVKAFLGRLRALRVQVNNPAEERAQRPGGGGRSQSEGKDPDGRRLQISGEDPDVRKFTEEEMAVHRAHVEACQCLACTTVDPGRAFPSLLFLLGSGFGERLAARVSLRATHK
ncbi:uncharacterized protein LOC130193837 isoform X3 [Pseudoliparis swirei]|uniref:uncharacterized protein LOC130193837 isoform X3 n=1 Tax=Pseudoliparis swirei TaxID=2059687 RepID=UPI0024BE6404|nr:uncharacterized protein LOC130193837 isoform X3 [Pseudoliparis swirei]